MKHAFSPLCVIKTSFMVGSFKTVIYGSKELLKFYISFYLLMLKLPNLLRQKTYYFINEFIIKFNVLTWVVMYKNALGLNGLIWKL